MVSSCPLSESETDRDIQVSYSFSHAEDCESGWEISKGTETIP